MLTVVKSYKFIHSTHGCYCPVTLFQTLFQEGDIAVNKSAGTPTLWNSQSRAEDRH